MFELTPHGRSYKEHVLWNFGASGDGAQPGGNLTPNVNGATLYGTTGWGGAYGQGTVFEITP